VECTTTVSTDGGSEVDPSVPPTIDECRVSRRAEDHTLEKHGVTAVEAVKAAESTRRNSRARTEDPTERRCVIAGKMLDGRRQWVVFTHEGWRRGRTITAREAEGPRERSRHEGLEETKWESAILDHRRRRARGVGAASAAVPNVGSSRLKPLLQHQDRESRIPIWRCRPGRRRCPDSGRRKPYQRLMRELLRQSLRALRAERRRAAAGRAPSRPKAAAARRSGVQRGGG